MTSEDKVRIVIYNGRVYLIDLSDLHEGETQETVLQKMIAGNAGFDYGEYHSLMGHIKEELKKVLWN